MISAERLRELLHYEPSTGVFTRLMTSGGRKAGTVAQGNLSDQGYWMISVCSKQYRAHRLAWLYVHGVWPEQIDHINGVKSDNRIANLRCVSRSVNLQNQRRAQSSNRTGLLGVSLRQGENKWQAQIMVNGKRYTLGRFTTPELAYAAYLKAKRELHEGCTI